MLPLKQRKCSSWTSRKHLWMKGSWGIFIVSHIFRYPQTAYMDFLKFVWGKKKKLNRSLFLLTISKTIDHCWVFFTIKSYQITEWSGEVSGWNSNICFPFSTLILEVWMRWKWGAVELCKVYVTSDYICSFHHCPLLIIKRQFFNLDWENHYRFNLIFSVCD